MRRLDTSCYGNLEKGSAQRSRILDATSAAGNGLRSGWGLGRATAVFLGEASKIGAR